MSYLRDQIQPHPRNTVRPKDLNEDEFGYFSELFVPKWSLRGRIAVLTLGAVSLISSFRSKGLLRRGLLAFGISSIIRAIVNLHVTAIIGWLANPAIRLKRAIFIKAPVDDVYDYLTHFDNFPQFMSFVNKVEINQEGGLRWTVEGPSRIHFSWNTDLRKLIPNRVISWRSSAHSFIRNSGEIQLIDLPGDGTVVQIELTYAPPGGAFGYILVHLLGLDPKEKIDQDLLTLRNILEKKYSLDEQLLEFSRA